MCCVVWKCCHIISLHIKRLTIISIKSPEIIPNTIMFAAMGFLLGAQERVRNSRGIRAISVRATEVLL